MSVRKSIIVGAGEAGRIVVREMTKRGKRPELAGFVDDNPELQKGKVEGLEVLGRKEDLSRLIEKYNCSDIIVAMPSVKLAPLQPLITELVSHFPHLNVYIIPSTERFFDRTPITPSLTDFHFADLLDREEYTVDPDIITERFAGKRILITGAGGSIGSELCLQLMKFDIDSLVALGRGEHSIYQLSKNLEQYRSLMDNPPAVEYRIANVAEPSLLKRLFLEIRPQVVIHAAAHKHVPLMEENAAEALFNNGGGTLNLLELSVEYGVEDFVLISTDKAVRPSSVMGATKRITELFTGIFHRDRGLRTTIVRFGNVLGSRGSVIPLFNQQIKKGGPVTVTHRDVTRFFMTIPEAVLLVLNATALSTGGGIFALDMGKQYNIADIARQLIALHGYSEEEIPIVYTGLRPGEKMYEELFFRDDGFHRTENSHIYFQEMLHNIPPSSMVLTMKEVLSSLAVMTDEEVIDFIREMVPEFISMKNDDPQRLIS
jgi:FlaA1/EpsC-like NDP-sugar epimerase